MGAKLGILRNLSNGILGFEELWSKVNLENSEKQILQDYSLHVGTAPVHELRKDRPTFNLQKAYRKALCKFTVLII